MSLPGEIAKAIEGLFGSLIDAAFSRPPVGLLLVTLAILAVSILPEGIREKARMAALAAFGLIVLAKVFWT